MSRNKESNKTKVDLDAKIIRDFKIIKINMLRKNFMQKINNMCEKIGNFHRETEMQNYKIEMLENKQQMMSDMKMSKLKCLGKRLNTAKDSIHLNVSQ